LEDVVRRIGKSDATLHQVYVDYIDLALHRHGTKSPEVRREVKRLVGMVRSILDLEKFTVVITADHGQIDIERWNILGLQDPGKVGGGPRDVFLYSGDPDDFPAIGREEFISLLGPGEEHPGLGKRVPDATILPDENSAVWYRRLNLRALHGGLSEEEMLVPFIVLDGKI